MITLATISRSGSNSSRQCPLKLWQHLAACQPSPHEAPAAPADRCGPCRHATGDNHASFTLGEFSVQPGIIHAPSVASEAIRTLHRLRHDSRGGSTDMRTGRKQVPTFCPLAHGAPAKQRQLLQSNIIQQHSPCNHLVATVLNMSRPPLRGSSALMTRWISSAGRTCSPLSAAIWVSRRSLLYRSSSSCTPDSPV